MVPTGASLRRSASLSVCSEAASLSQRPDTRGSSRARPPGRARAHLAGPQAPLQVRLVLDRTTVVAGTIIHGVALLTNTTDHTITVKACAADGWFEVGLSNGRITFDGFPSPAVRVCTVSEAGPRRESRPIRSAHELLGLYTCEGAGDLATPRVHARRHTAVGARTLCDQGRYHRSSGAKPGARTGPCHVAAAIYGEDRRPPVVPDVCIRTAVVRPNVGPTILSLLVTRCSNGFFNPLAA